ncbi:MAG: SEC-C metal-binding domain-containing protein [Longimicrobiales bacterium]
MSDTDYEVRLTSGRNDPCLCGSGKKYKKCHLAEDEGARTAALKALEQEAVAHSKDTQSEVDAKRADDSIRSSKRPKNQPGPKGRPSGGKPKNVARRGAV